MLNPLAQGGPKELIDSFTETVAKGEGISKIGGRQEGLLLEGGVKGFRQAKQGLYVEFP